MKNTNLIIKMKTLKDYKSFIQQKQWELYKMMFYKNWK